MGKTLYLDCNSGISGDMMVACLLDLGASEEKLQKVLETVPADGFEIKISRVKKSGIDCMDFDVVLDKEHENHDHDMEYLHGHDHEDYHHHHDHEEHDHHHDHEDHHHHHDHEEHDHHHDHEDHHHHHDHEEHDHHHDHEDHNHHHDHEDHHHHHHHEHRSLQDVYGVIDKTTMSDNARKIAKDIFMVVAKAEAKAHGTSLEEVHFHEVGAIDSIVDIISVAVCLDELNISEVCVPKLCEGQGTVRCQHGILPIPVPAVANIISDYRLPVELTNTKGELVTPTGAAIVAAIATSFDKPKKMIIEKIGLGAGKRTYERPSILRGMIISNTQDEDAIYKLETNVDDSTGEMLGYLMEKLMKEGARDVNYHPVFMKKNRPGYQINVICKEEDIKKIENIIFRETTTIGIRRIKMERTILQRRSSSVSTKYGDIKVKECVLTDGTVRVYPEYESVKEVCDKLDVAFPEVINTIKNV